MLTHKLIKEMKEKPIVVKESNPNRINMSYAEAKAENDQIAADRQAVAELEAKQAAARKKAAKNSDLETVVEEDEVEEVEAEEIEVGETRPGDSTPEKPNRGLKHQNKRSK